MRAKFSRSQRDVDKTYERLSKLSEQLHVERKNEEQGQPESEEQVDGQNDELKAKLELLENELASHRERERLIAETMLVAQSAAKELRERAESEAKAIRQNAQAEVDALRQKATEESEAIQRQAKAGVEEISRHADEERRQAEQEREAIVTQAKADADDIRRSAESERVELASEIERLRTMRSDVEETVRLLLLRTLEALERSPAEDEEVEHLLADGLKNRAREASPNPSPRAEDEW